MKRTLLALSLLAVAGLLFTGCETTPDDTGAYVPINTTVNDAENHEMIVLLDQPRADFRHLLRHLSKNFARWPARCDRQHPQPRGPPHPGPDQLRVQGRHGRSHRRRGIPFRNLILTENAQEPVHFVSMNDKARRYTIRIREAH